jgi:hypothetical protein
MQGGGTDGTGGDEGEGGGGDEKECIPTIENERTDPFTAKINESFASSDAPACISGFRAYVDGI